MQIISTFLNLFKYGVSIQVDTDIFRLYTIVIINFIMLVQKVVL